MQAFKLPKNFNQYHLIFSDDEIFDEVQTGQQTLSLVSFLPIVSSVHEWSCWNWFAHVDRIYERVHLGEFYYLYRTGTYISKPFLSIFSLPEAASFVSPWPWSIDFPSNKIPKRSPLKFLFCLYHDSTWRMNLGDPLKHWLSYGLILKRTKMWLSFKIAY